MRTAYLKSLYALTSKDSNVYALLADNGIIVYDQYRMDFPNNFLNLGISECNMVGFAAGMANQGKIPFVYTIGAFLSIHALEYIRNDVCLQNQNVKLIGTGAGMVYSALGPTHHTTEDLGALRSLSNLVIITPASPLEVEKATLAAYKYNGPVYIRLGTNREPEIYRNNYEFEIGKSIVVKDGKDITLIGMGSILQDVIEVAEKALEEGISVKVINMHTLNPFDKESVIREIDRSGRIITVEDHNVVGGLGSATAEVIAEYGKPVRFKRLGLVDFSHGYGTYDEMKQQNGIGKERIMQEIKRLIGE